MFGDRTGDRDPFWAQPQGSAASQIAGEERQRVPPTLAACDRCRRWRRRRTWRGNCWNRWAIGGCTRRLWPLAPTATLRDQFRQYKTLRCTITEPPKFERLDASTAGGAQVKFGMKQEIQMRSGGAPIRSDSAGALTRVVGLSPAAVAGDLRTDAANLALSLGPNDAAVLDSGRLVERVSPGFTPPQY